MRRELPALLDLLRVSVESGSRSVLRWGRWASGPAGRWLESGARWVWRRSSACRWPGRWTGSPIGRRCLRSTHSWPRWSARDATARHWGRRWCLRRVVRGWLTGARSRNARPAPRRRSSSWWRCCSCRRCCCSSPRPSLPPLSAAADQGPSCKNRCISAQKLQPALRNSTPARARPQVGPPGPTTQLGRISLPERERRGGGGSPWAIWTARWRDVLQSGGSGVSGARITGPESRGSSHSATPVRINSFPGLESSGIQGPFRLLARREEPPQRPGQVPGFVLGRCGSRVRRWSPASRSGPRRASRASTRRFLAGMQPPQPRAPQAHPLLRGGSFDVELDSAGRVTLNPAARARGDREGGRRRRQRRPPRGLGSGRWPADQDEPARRDRRDRREPWPSFLT